MIQPIVTYKGQPLHGWKKWAAIVVLFGGVLWAFFWILAAVMVMIPAAIMWKGFTGRDPKWIKYTESK